MPQEIRVLQCYKCQIYQVNLLINDFLLKPFDINYDQFQTDIAKKINKWTCKMCNEKQSLRREFLRGTGIECRIRAQMLNERHKQDRDYAVQLLDQLDFEEEFQADGNRSIEQTGHSDLPKTISKWHDVIDNEGENESEDEQQITSTLHTSKWNNMIEIDIHDANSLENQVSSRITSNLELKEDNRLNIQNSMPNTINCYNIIEESCSEKVIIPDVVHSITTANKKRLHDNYNYASHSPAKRNLVSDSSKNNQTQLFDFHRSIVNKKTNSKYDENVKVNRQHEKIIDGIQEATFIGDCDGINIEPRLQSKFVNNVNQKLKPSKVRDKVELNRCSSSSKWANVIEPNSDVSSDSQDDFDYS